MNKNISLSIRKTISLILILTCISSLVACSKDKNSSEDSSNNNIDNSEEINSSNDKESDIIVKDDNKDSSSSAEKSGSIITLGNKAFDIFYGNEESAKKYSQVISNFKEGIGKNVSVYNMVVPTHVEFGLPDKYSEMSNSQKDAINNIHKDMSKDVKTVDAYSALEKHKDEYIYFNTDHHWTSLGAYYAYEAFAKEAGFEPVNINEYERFTKEGFLGTFYTQTKDKNLKSNPDKVEYYKIPEKYSVYRYEKDSLDKPVKSTLYADYAEGVNMYSLFLHGDFPMVTIENNNKKLDKKIVVVK